MSTLITGAAGFIGSNLTERLISNNENIVCIDNFDDFYSPDIKKKNILSFEDKIPFYECDINDTDEVTDLIKNHNIEKIVHIAARPGVRQSLENPYLYNKINCIGTINLLDIAKNNNIKQFVFSSTSSIYGANKKTPFSESDKVEKQLSPYAISKRAAELYGYNYSNLYDIPVTVLRLFTVYGPRQRPEMAIHKFCRQISNGEELAMFGDGSTSRDYTFIDDIIDGFISALKSPFDFEIINLGDSSPVKLTKLIELIEKELGKKANIKQLPEQPGDMKITFADIAKASEMLNYQPKVTLEEGIKIFVKWYKESR